MTASEHIPAGDSRYDGFRIEELWIFTCVDPTDNQEGVLADHDRPIIASDQRAVDELRELVRISPHPDDTMVKHFRLVDTEEL